MPHRGRVRRRTCADHVVVPPIGERDPGELFSRSGRIAHIHLGQRVEAPVPRLDESFLTNPQSEKRRIPIGRPCEEDPFLGRQHRAVDGTIATSPRHFDVDADRLPASGDRNLARGVRKADAETVRFENRRSTVRSAARVTALTEGERSRFPTQGEPSAQAYEHMGGNEVSPVSVKAKLLGTLPLGIGKVTRPLRKARQDVVGSGYNHQWSSVGDCVSSCRNSSELRPEDLFTSDQQSVVPRPGVRCLVTDLIAARRPLTLGPGYWKLLTAAAISTVGDGVFLTAVPLLAAKLTRDPLRVSLVAFAGWLPCLLCGLVSGALVDRLDRRKVMWSVDACRFLVVCAFAVAVWAGEATLALLAVVGFLLGVGQSLFDPASQSIIPALVSPDGDAEDSERLDLANGRLLSTQTVGQQFAGPLVGGLLFATTAVAPFLVDAVSFGASAGLVASIPGRFTARNAAPPGTGPATSVTLRQDIAEGLRWLLGHRLIRLLAIQASIANLAFMAGGAVLVLFAQERLELGSSGYGLLLAGGAVGGILGGLVAAPLRRWLGPGRLLVANALVSAASYATLGFTSNPWVAGAMLSFVGMGATVGSVVIRSLRQQLAPNALLGRVVSAFRMVALGSVPLGAIIGGTSARLFGLGAPFFFGGGLLLVTSALALPLVREVPGPHPRQEAR